MNVCQICNEGSLQPLIGRNSVEYNGQRTQLDIHYSRCDGCGSEQSDAMQLRLNKRAMVAFKKRVNGLLTGLEVRILRERLGLRQADAARVFGGGPVAFSKYESDDVTQSEAMDKLLRLADELPAAFEMLCERVRIDSTIQDQRWRTAEDWKFEHLHNSASRRPILRVVSSSAPDSRGREKFAA